MNDDTRATLLEQLRDGTSPLAWDEFFRRYWLVVYDFARRRGCSGNTAEDVVQDVMLKVFQQRDIFRYDPERGRFRDWLHTVVRHQVAEYRRRPSERPRVGHAEDVAADSPAVDERGPDDVWESAFENALLLDVLDVVRREANPRDFLAFELTILAEVAPAEVAAITGLTRNAVYKARRRILRRLEELAAGYAAEGHLPERVRQALRLRPAPATERKLSRRVRETLSRG